MPDPGLTITGPLRVLAAVGILSGEVRHHLGGQ
jgi:hypothetical protein